METLGTIIQLLVEVAVVAFVIRVSIGILNHKGPDESQSIIRYDQKIKYSIPSQNNHKKPNRSKL